MQLCIRTIDMYQLDIIGKVKCRNRVYWSDSELIFESFFPKRSTDLISRSHCLLSLYIYVCAVKVNY